MDLRLPALLGAGFDGLGGKGDRANVFADRAGLFIRRPQHRSTMPLLTIGRRPVKWATPSMPCAEGLFGAGVPATCLDHRIPWINGGKTTVNNLYPMCEEHNAAKGDLDYWERLLSSAKPHLPRRRF